VASYSGANSIDLILSRLENNDQFFPRDHVRKTINLCIRNTNLWLGWYQGSVIIPTVKDRVAYDVPNNMIFPMSLSLEGRVINKAAFDSTVADNQKLWRESTANTGVQMSDWSLMGIRKFVVYPADSRGGRAMSLSGVMEPPVFDTEASVVTIPVNVYNTIVDYASHAIQIRISGQPYLQSMQFYKIYANFMKLNMVWRGASQQYFTDETRASE